MSGNLRALLDQLDQAHAAGTPGPWEATGPRADGGAYIDSTRAGLDDGSSPWIGHAHRERDAALIVAAVNAVKPLVAAVRAAADLAEQLERDGTVYDDYPLHAADRLRAALAPLTAEDAR